MADFLSEHGTKRKWRKILYGDLGYPDNYVDSSFLDEMKKNIATTIHGLREVVTEAEVVSRQLSCVAIFLAIFGFLSQGWASPHLVLFITSIAVLAGFCSFCILEGHPIVCKQNVMNAISCSPYLALCYGLSPVLITLTRTISEDTLYAMTSVMLFAYLVLYDYGRDATMVSAPVSLNAAIFASVCLASRLPTVTHTFAIVFVALATFALWPVLHRRLGTISHPVALDAFTTLLAVLATVAVSYLSTVFSCLLLLTHILIVGFCPLLFVRLQNDKHNIHGPWDEAVIED